MLKGGIIIKYLLSILCLFIFSCSEDSNPVSAESHNHDGVCAGIVMSVNPTDYRCFPNLSQLGCFEYEASINYGISSAIASFDWYLDIDCYDWCLTIPDDEECDIND